MTLKGAGYFDDESVWNPWISPPSADQSRHWYSPSWAMLSTNASSVRHRRTYRKRGSHITLIVPAPVSANLILGFQLSKNNIKLVCSKTVWAGRQIWGTGGKFSVRGPGLFLNSSEFFLCIIGNRHVLPTHYSRKPSSYHATFLFCFRASYSTNAAHMNPANSLATAVVALQGILPLLTSLR